MTRGLAKSDISDLDFVDAAELASDGQSAFLTSVTVVSTTGSTKRVVVSGIYMLNDADQRVEPGDKITLSGTTGGADGTYTVDSVVDDVTLEVVEALVDSTGGTADFTWTSGAHRIGFDATALTHINANNLQEALRDVDAAITTNTYRLRQTVFAAITVNTTTTSSSFVTLLTQNITISTGGIIIATVTAGLSNATANRGVGLRLLINGTAYCGTFDRLPAASTSAGFPLQWRVSGLSAGTYAVTVEWVAPNGGTAQCRPVTVPNYEHCALLIREVTT